MTSAHLIRPWLLFVCLLLAAGCNNAPESSADKDRESENTVGETAAEKCRKKLASAIRRLAPQELSVQANPERSINGLNAWLASCASDELEELKLNETALALVNSNVRATAGRFTVNDSSYIRDCLLLRDLTATISERAAADGTDVAVQEAAVVTAVFNWVVRNVSLVSDAEKRPPLGLFDVLLTGRGTPEDRGWIFAEALRQLQIDAFIIHPQADAESDGDILATADWLIGVVLDDDSMLFDMQSGLPVPEGEGSDLLNLTPAKLSVLTTNERWKESQVQVIAQTAAFAPRMLVLQQQLAVEDSAVLYEELTGGVSEIRPILERISSAEHGFWKADSISIWPYPEDSSVASQSLSEEQRKQYRQLMRPFDAPFERKTFATESTEELTTVPEELSPQERQALVQQRLMDNFSKMMESSEEMFGKPSKRLLKTRIQQVRGADETGVIQQMQQIRITSMESVVRIQVPVEVQAAYGFPKIMAIPFPQMIREVNLSSTGAALYWTAIRQMELGDVGAAITTMMNYRRQYQSGQWTYPSMINQALAMLVQERRDDAVSLLKEADVEENPERFRVRQMLKILAP